MIEAGKTALAILNFNGKKHLERFLPSVIKFSSPDVKIIVGDNCSTDDSVSFLKEHYPAVETVILDQNYGFAEGYNQVLRQIHAEYYFLLNSDVELKEPWAPMIQYLDHNPGVAAVQPKILSHAQPDHFEHAGAAGGWIDELGYPFCAGRILNKFEEDRGQYDSKCEIFWASGAAMIVRSNLFHELGGFDGDYFAHMEEIDWCWRAKKNGWKIMAIPEIKVYHIGGGTLPYNSERKIFLNFRNNIATLIKNEPAGKLLYVVPYRLFLDTIAMIQFFIKGNVKGSAALIKAYINILKWIPSLIKKRKIIGAQSEGKKFESAGLFHGSLLYQFFILGKKSFSDIIKNHNVEN